MDRLTSAIRRALQRRGVSIDPFSIMELATILKPALKDRSSPGSSVESAVEFLAGILERSYVDNPSHVAGEIVKEVVEFCRREDCS